MVSSSHRSSGPRPGAGKKKVTNQVAPKEAKGKRERRSGKKQTGKCFRCGENGHWKPDCPKKGKATEAQADVDHCQWMDVKTAFLNGSLEETIYMEQPEGYAVKGKEHMSSRYFRCGEKGHWKPECPKRGKATGDKATM
ncbi:DNA-binding protein HEXBP-like [Salvia hispanica]|uniref:DNA-binding protein HEXBP-like n=1 Tax=Salvia hispanica TaxID=49212 RepID=UPI0020099BBB|nr:DNA-binding protein HEXBP-like [Salvia hispanica]